MADLVMVILGGVVLFFLIVEGAYSAYTLTIDYINRASGDLIKQANIVPGRKDSAV
ncbi:MAG: hypothetical protein L6Q98_24635 [Anaerolineae bacterium]|nr:hypothetical protein [Anaerolineae bacterium]NUQ07165.1 hypothetical protein [Anaerolineae bacterium]